MATEIKLPELGEGITSGTVAALIAQPGDKVGADDAILELETDKAVVPVPAGVSGIVATIAVLEGDEIKPGDLLATLTAEEGDGATSNLENKKPTLKKEISTEKKTSETSEAAIPTPDKLSQVVVSPQDIPAGPATRKLARELGINLAEIQGTARGGRITLEDVKNFAKSKMAGGSASISIGIGLKPLLDLSLHGEVQKEKITKLRSIISERMAINWTNIPHVHQFQEVDITEIVNLQKKYADQFKEKGSTLSVTQFLIKALALALKKFPSFNASFDHIHKEMVYKKYFHIVVAVDTPSGLIVPVLRNVNAKSIFDIGKELKEIAKRTRERKVDPSELQGGCITLSNLGGIGGTHFTPIINHPEVAILGAGRSAVKPVYRDGQFLPRTLLPLCLAYDHRVIDGADGARFIMFLTDYLENIEYHMMQ